MRKKIYYQDCGVLGGRTIFHTGAEFDTIESPDPIGILNDLMSRVYQDFEKNGKDHRRNRGVKPLSEKTFIRSPVKLVNTYKIMS